ncbi:uncharacterized protein L203_102182 [Cryptococcus depauperatus CBS 7841]|uniref:GC-rich sequence DNA-binding factor n=1 Tax=Cryptococcus depauperatus CBS 7841 TaxID=1295531 RepID=A0AAJ8JRD3_9TREE
MFLKRARPRPSLRARESDLPDSVSTSSPLSKTSPVPTVDHTENPKPSIENGLDESSGSLLDRKMRQKKDKGKNKPGTKGASLSFGGEDEKELFKPRKSILSQRIKLPSTTGEFTSSSATVPSDGSSGLYSQEYLLQLKAATPTRAPSNATDTIHIDENKDVNGSGFSRIALDKYASSFAQDKTAGIPDVATITAAKLKRQAGLGNNEDKIGGEEDYISLNEGIGGGRIAIYDAQQGPHPESRLMREEDEEDEGDEDMADYTGAKEKLYLGKDQNKAAARRLRGEIDELIADREEDEEDEESLEWEKAQVQRSGLYEEEKIQKAVKQVYVPTPIPMIRPVPTISSAEARLNSTLSDLEDVKKQNQHNLDVVVQELAALESQERELRQEVEKAESKKEYMEEFRRWVEVLGKFLEEKFPKLEDIELDSISHLKERSQAINARREADDSDDLSLFLGVAAFKDEEEETDELGRVKNVGQYGPNSGIRKGRREARKARRAKRIVKKSLQTSEDEGYSTDSTLADVDAEDYKVAQNKLEHRAYALLQDVKAEDFRDPEKGLAVRFGGWRMKDEEEYLNAFGGLALVQAWEFWARGEMIGWEPLQDQSPLESFRWFHALHHYCHPRLSNSDDEETMDEEPSLSPEGDLVASMVSSAVAPLLTKMFEAEAYDPYSTAQTRNAVDLTNVVAELTGRDSRKFMVLLKAVLQVFHTHLISLSTAISAVTSPSAFPPPDIDPISGIAMRRYVQRRIKLLKNMLMWSEQASQEVRELIARLVGEVLRPILSRNWERGGKEMALKVLAVATNYLSPDLVTFLQQGPDSRR